MMILLAAVLSVSSGFLSLRPVLVNTVYHLEGFSSCSHHSFRFSNIYIVAIAKTTPLVLLILLWVIIVVPCENSPSTYFTGRQRHGCKQQLGGI